MKTKFIYSLMLFILSLYQANSVFGQTFCLIDQFGETFNLTATPTADPNLFMISGLAFTNSSGEGANWPCSGSFETTSGNLSFTIVNPHPANCSYYVDSIFDTYNYNCGKATSCPMHGSYTQYCLGTVIGGPFPIDATVYKRASACAAQGPPVEARMALAHPGNKISLVEAGNLAADKDQISASPGMINNNVSVNLLLRKPGEVIISVYNVQGYEVKQIVNQYMEIGNYTFQWNEENATGTMVGNGIYFIVLRKNNSVLTIPVLKN